MFGNRRLIVTTFLIAFLSLVGALVLTFFLHRPELRVVAEWKQPDSIEYKSFDPYYLSVVTRDMDYSGFPFHIERNYFIYVGRESGTPTYGHMIKFSFHGGYDPVEDHIKQSEVRWETEGVWFETQSGHKLFIPEKMFIGGR